MGRKRKALVSHQTDRRHALNLVATAERFRDAVARFAGTVNGIPLATSEVAEIHYINTIMGYSASLSKGHAVLQRAIGLYLASVGEFGQNGTPQADRA